MKSKKKNQRKAQIIYHIILIIMCIVTLYPLLLCLGTSLSDEQTVLSNGYKMIPEKFSLEGYKYVFSNPSKIINAYKVTIGYSVLDTFLTLFCCSLAAYPLSQSKFRFRNKLNFFFYLPTLFGGGIVPVYLLNTRYLNIDDTFWI